MTMFIFGWSTVWAVRNSKQDTRILNDPWLTISSVKSPKVNFMCHLCVVPKCVCNSYINEVFLSVHGFTLFFLTDRKRSPSATRDPNQKYDQREEKAERSQYAPGEGGMPRSPSDYGAGDRQRRGGYDRSYEDAEVARSAYRARRGGWHSQEEYPPEPGFLPDGPPLSEHELQRQRQEEYQNRYRSDPNLARYPVKPQPYEEQMRMHAEVSRFRHERRHSDVSLAYTEMEEPLGPLRGPPYSPGPGHTHWRSNHSPPGVDSLHRQQHLDPVSAVRKSKREKMDSMLRNDSLSSDQSESVRPPPPKPHKTKRGGKMRQVSLSSSEEELATTPEYTSCEDVEIESESVSEKGNAAFS